jgi:hypothetical protein
VTKTAARKRLDDPDGHYPYKLDDALALDWDAPAGPNGPDDTSRRVSDFLTEDLAHATARYVDAQAAYVEDPGDGTKAAYDSARDQLIAARQAHRQGRPGATTVEG